MHSARLHGVAVGRKRWNRPPRILRHRWLAYGAEMIQRPLSPRIALAILLCLLAAAALAADGAADGDDEAPDAPEEQIA